jgi:pyruvate kinase
LLSKYHPDPPIFALSPYERVVNRNMLLWGTFPILCEHARDTDKLVGMAEDILQRKDFVHRGQVVGIVAGTRTKSGATNFMRLHMIGDSVDAEARQRARAGKRPAAKKK